MIAPVSSNLTTPDFRALAQTFMQQRAPAQLPPGVTTTPEGSIAPERPSVQERVGRLFIAGLKGVANGIILGREARTFGPVSRPAEELEPFELTDEEKSLFIGMLGIGASAYIAPALTAAVAVTGTGLRTVAGESPAEAALSTIEQGLALGEPVADVLERTGQERLADLIREHPIVAEFVLQFGHDISVFAAQRGATRLVTRALDVTDGLDRAMAETFERLPPIEFSPALDAALRRIELDQPVLRATLAQQMQALMDQRIAAQRALEIAPREGTIVGAGGRAFVPEPGLVDLEAALREEPHAFFVSGKKARGLSADVRSGAADATSLAGRQATTLDQLAVNIEREVLAAEDVGRALTPIGRPEREAFLNAVLGPEAATVRQAIRQFGPELSERTATTLRAEGLRATTPEGARVLHETAEQMLHRPRTKTRAGPTEQELLTKSPREIQELALKQAKTETDLEVSIFGEEGAQEYARLQRRAHGTGKAADAASERIAEMEGSLTPSQRDRLFGINTFGLNAEDLSSIAQTATAARLLAQEASKAQLLNELAKEIITGRGKNIESVLRLRELLLGARRLHLNAEDVTAAVSRQSQRQGLSQSDVEILMAGIALEETPSGLKLSSLETRFTTLEEAARHGAQTGSGVRLYSMLFPDLSALSKRQLWQGGFLASGMLLSDSDDEYLAWTGRTLLALGAGSVLYPTIARASKTAANAFVRGPLSGTLGEGQALAFARWFAPEYGYAREFVQIRQMVNKMRARGQGVAQDYAREIQAIAREAGIAARSEARGAGFTRREVAQLAEQETTLVRRALSDIGEAEGPGAARIAQLPEALQERALNVVQRTLDEFYNLGRQQVELGRFAQATFDLRSGQYLPRFYLDLERAAFIGKADDIGELTLRKFAARPVRGLRVSRVGIRDDAIPYQVRVDQLGEIRELDYRVLRGMSRDTWNVASETAYKMLRELPDRVWGEHDNAMRQLRKLQRARIAMELNEAPTADFTKIGRAIRGARRALADLERNVPEGFVRLPDAETLGSMRGRFVDRETARFLRQFEQVATPSGFARVWNELFGAWKFAMTALNLPTHMGNIGSNFVLAHTIGGLPWWRVDVYRRALRDYVQRGPMYRELRDQGVIGRTFIRQETQASVRELTETAMGDVRQLLRDVYDVEGLQGTIRGAVKKQWADTERHVKAIGNVYQAEEEMFKVAVHTYHRGLGKSAEEAAAIANTALVDYSARSGFINLMNQTLVPFFTFPAKIFNPLMRAIVEHPERLPLALAPFVAVDLIARHIIGAPFIQPYDTRKKGAFDIRYTQIPLITEDGEMVFVNTGRFTPLGPFVTGSPVEMILPSWWPQALTPSHPLASVASLLFNRDPVSGDPLVTDLQTAPERAVTLAREGMRIVVPSMFSRNLWNAIAGMEQETARETAIELSGVVGTRPVFVEQTGILQRMGMKGRVNELRREIFREAGRAMRRARTPADSAEVRQRAREMSLRLLQIIREMQDQLPPLQRQQQPQQ